MTCESNRAPGPARVLAIAMVTAVVAACHPAAPQAPRSQAIHSEAWQLPAPIGASLADLSTTPSGALLLSWTQPGNGDDQALMFSRYVSGHWSPPTAIVHAPWFGNAMDVPHVRMTADGTLWAQWLARNPTSAHARDVVLSRSLDDGRTWSPPVNVNTDGTPTEHGFAALWPASRDRLGIAWLDGRAATASGTTMLRAATFGTDLKRDGETVVDISSCDCCRTSVAMSANGPILAYRGRTAAEVRDTMVTRLDGGHWRTPVNVHADGWILKGCPMNGPAIAANGDAAVVAWYTAVGDVPAVRVAYSRDGGQRFTTPLDLAHKPRVQGRVDAALSGNGAWVTWLDDDAGTPALKLARIDFAVDTPASETITLRKLDGGGHAIGYSRIAALGGKLYVLWSDAAAGRPILAGAVVSRQE